MWLGGAAALLASQMGGGESGDVSVLQEKQKRLKVRHLCSARLSI